MSEELKGIESNYQLFAVKDENVNDITRGWD